jgi:hypothetical protein
MIPQPDSFQDLQLEIIRRTSFNELDGEKVHAELLAHRDLWKSALIDRLNSLTKLRDLHLDIWNADTLFILPVEGKEDELFKLAKKWNADEVNWIGREEACDLLQHWNDDSTSNSKVILRLWWD